jgi:hypothetical protein
MVIMENADITRKRSFGDTLRGAFYSVKVKIGFAFILGVIAGFVLFALLKVNISGAGVSKDDVKGTMWDSRTFDQMAVADKFAFNNGIVNATFDVRYSTKIVEMHIQVASQNMMQTVIDFDSQNFQVYAVQNMNPNDQSSTVSGVSNVVLNNIGSNYYVILLYNKNSLSHVVNYTLLQDENRMYQYSVTVNKE